MKITALETIQAEEFSNLLWVRVHTDAGVIGLGETFYGAGAVAAHIHTTLAGRLLGKDPLRIERHAKEMVDLPLAQASTGAEYRAASAIDIALWDLFGKVCGQPVHQMLGGLAHDKVRIYNTCAGYQYVRSANIRPVDTWNFSDEGPYEDLRAFMERPGELAQSLLSQGITGMKIWPFDPPARKTGGHYISAEDLKKALWPFEEIRKAVGDKMDIMVEFHCLWDLPTAKQIARALAPYEPYWLEDAIRMNSSQALAEYARSTPFRVCASETLGSAHAYEEMLNRDAMDIVMTDICWTGGLTEARKIAALADIHHKPFAPHDCTGPIGLIAAVHASLSQPNTIVQETVRAFYTGWYKEVVTTLPTFEDGYVLPMEGPGLGTDLLPGFLERGDLTVIRSDL